MTDYEEHGLYEFSPQSDEECQEPEPFVHKVGSRHFVCNWLLPYIKRHGIIVTSVINLHSLLNTYDA